MYDFIAEWLQGGEVDVETFLEFVLWDLDTGVIDGHFDGGVKICQGRLYKESDVVVSTVVYLLG